MQGTRPRMVAKLGGLLLGLGVLADCGPATTATNTAPPAATGTQPVIGSPAIQSTTTTTRAPAATVTRTTTAATTRGTTAPGTTSPTRPGPATPGTPGPPARPAEPGLAFRNLQALDSYRQVWDFSGFALAGNQGELRAVYEHNGDDVRGVLASGGNRVFEAYRIL